MRWTDVYRYQKGKIGQVAQILRRPDAKKYAARGYVSELQVMSTIDPPHLMRHTVKAVISTAVSGFVDGTDFHGGTCLVEVERIDYPGTREVMFGVTVTPVEDYSGPILPFPAAPEL